MTVTKQWQNWSGSVRFTPTEILYPETLDEIVKIVKQCAATGRTLRVVGTGHSFTPLVITDGVLLSLDRYAGLEHIDKAAPSVTVKAGTKIKALGELLSANGLAQENLGDIDVQSIAGAISTGTHGTGVTMGSISTQVIGLTLVTADGSVLTCSETQQPEIFKAAQVSLGALGIVVSVTLRVVPAYTLRVETRKKELSDILTNLESYKHDNRHFEIQWIPYTNYVQAKFINMTSDAPRPPSFFRKFNEVALENGALWLFSAINRQFPRFNERICNLMTQFITDVTDVSSANQVFASIRLVKFQEMEYNIPAEHFVDAIREVDAAIRQQQIKVHFPIECRFVKGDDIYLSPAYGRDSAYIAVHMFKGMEYRKYFDIVEAILRGYNGRPHWGKMHTRTATDLAPVYPKWEAYQAIRRQLDPNGIFMNEHLKTVLGK